MGFGNKESYFEDYVISYVMVATTIKNLSRPIPRRVHNIDARPCKRCVASSSRLAKISCFSTKYFDQTHERNARKRRDRIRVYPSVPMRCDQRQRTTDATQRKALRRIVNPP